MTEVKQERIGEMGMRRRKDKGKRHAQNRDAAVGRQAVGFGLRKIDDKRHIGGGSRVAAQKADAARLDQAAQRGRAAGDEGLAFAGKFGAVIGDEAGAKRQKAQRKRGLARAGWPEDQQATPVQRDRAGVKHRPVARIGHTGKPMTKRAPKGGEVGSAAVGRMFSAQITPPCASMICLEIARPRPEWLPKSPFGRSE